VRQDVSLCADKMKMKTGESNSDRRHRLYRTPISVASTQRRDNENGKEGGGEKISLRTLNLLSILNMNLPSAAVWLARGERYSTHHHLWDRRVWSDKLLRTGVPRSRRTPMSGSERGKTFLSSARVQARVIAAAGRSASPKGYLWACRRARRYRGIGCN